MKRSQLLNIFFIIFIVLMGFGLIMPLMPFYVAKYGGSQFLVGLLIASYAMAQFIGAPLFGRLSDDRGRRPLLAASMAGTAFGFLLLALAEPLGRGLASLFSAGTASETLQNSTILWVMFFSRFVTGLSGGIITVAQAYIADITDEQTRTQGMGIIGAAFGLGFILGPVLGGVLSQWGFAVPAYAAAGLALLSLVTILSLLPESLTEERRAELAQQPKRPLISLPDLVRKMGAPRLGPLLVIRLVVSIASALFFALFTLWAMDRLGLDARNTAYLMAYAGFLSVVAQIGLIGPLTRRFDQFRLIVWSSGIFAAAMLAWALTPTVWLLVVVMIPHAFATGVLNTVINSATTWAVAPHEMGDALGASSSLESLSRVIAPTVGGWLLGVAGTWAPGVLGAIIMAGLTPFAWQKLIVNPPPPLEVPVLLEQEVVETPVSI